MRPFYSTSLSLVAIVVTMVIWVFAAWLGLNNMTARYTRHRWNVLAEKDPALMPSKAKARAERLLRQQQKAPKALADYRAKQEATRNLTAKLRAERLAREAIHGKPKPDRKRATKS